MKSEKLRVRRVENLRKPEQVKPGSDIGDMGDMAWRADCFVVPPRNDGSAVEVESQNSKFKVKSEKLRVRRDEKLREP